MELKEIIKHERENLDPIKDEDALAVHDAKCPKCGYNKAQLFSKGIWYSDEDEAMFYKCGKCGRTWQIGGHRVK